MRRYCISPVIGSGALEDPYRAAVSDVAGTNSAAVIPNGVNGQPLYNFALCIVAAPVMTQIAQVSNLYLLPDLGLDSRMDAMEGGARTGMVQSVEAYDLDGNGLNFDADHGDADSYRTLINSLGQQLDAAFDADRFGVSEPGT